MSIKTVNEVISRILRESAPKVVAIKGAWGCGKTHAWQNLIADLRGECHRQEYSYASLFGITSINQLRTALFANTQAISTNAKSADEYVDPLAIRIRDFRRSSKQFNDKIKAAIDHLPFGKIATIAIDSVLPFLLKDKVICLDDFERMGKSIEPDELLGFISELKEQNNCQVVLIFNEQKLTETQKKVYQDYREKVIDIELVYAPTVDEAIQIALPMDLPCRNQLALHIDKLKIRNIRIIFKIAEVVRLIHPEIASYGEAVLAQMSQTLVLLIWMEYGDSEDGMRPDLNFYKYWQSERWNLNQHQQDHQFNEWEKRWDKQFCDYGILNLDYFDRSIYKVIRNGYVEESQIREFASSLNQQRAQAEPREKFLRSWDKLTDSFDDNQDEVILDFIEAASKGIPLLEWHELDMAMRFLREFNKNSEADTLLEAFISAKPQEAKWFNQDEYKPGGQLPEFELLLGVRAIYEEGRARAKPSLEELITQIQNVGIFSDKVQQFMTEANQNDFYALFKAIRGPKLKEIVMYCLRNRVARDQDGLSPVQVALQRITDESQLNAYRVSHFRKQAS